MEAVDARQVDQIVVYKIDRLTRSLADFAELVDRLDQAEASFVSVTQSFNTATSMGRLTLNVLLSFAQFEREVTAERIRDKIAASKRKGLWMGGNVPLGYDPDSRTLQINEEEAETVEAIYQLYEDHGTMNLVLEQACVLGLRSKNRRMSDGSLRGGNLMSRGQLHHILTNPIYAGRIRHKGKVFKGQHPAIVDPDRREDIQRRLSTKAQVPRLTRHHRDPSPLAGKIVDEAGERLTPSHTKKGNRRYRYYISKRLTIGTISSEEKQRTWRIPAKILEEIVASVVEARVQDLAAAIGDQDIARPERARLDAKTLLTLVRRVGVSPGRLDIDLCPDAISKFLGAKHQMDPDDLSIVQPFTERRRGVEMKMIARNGTPQIDQRMLTNVALANRWYRQLKAGHSFDEIASEAGTSKRRVQQIVDLAFLAPDIVRDITKGLQPTGLTSDWCLRHALPVEWQAQRERIATL